MKFYARTLLIFLVVIGIQAVLTAGLIMGLVSRNNQNTARTELREESVLVYDNYYSWIRDTWKSVISLYDDDYIKTIVDATDNRTGQVRLINGISEILKGSDIDSFIIRQGNWDHFEVLTDPYPFISDFEPFVSERDHPYISLKLHNQQTFLSSTLRLSENTEVFLLKHFDNDFYNQLKGRSHAELLVSTDGIIFSDLFDGSDELANLVDGPDKDAPHRELFDTSVGKDHYNLSLQNIGALDRTDNDVFLLVFLSTEPYRSLLSRIWKIVFLVTLAILALTAVMALFFSGRVTRPIKRLVAAMKKIRDGDYSASVATRSGGEVGNLMDGFNEMAVHLHRNRSIMDDNIREITFLRDYNETIIHSLQAGIVVVNSALLVEKVNGFFLESFKHTQEEILGTHLNKLAIDLLDKEIVEAAVNVIDGRSEYWSKVKREEGSVWDIKIYPLKDKRPGESGQCVLEFDDISRKMDLEEKIFQAEKLTSLSFLSAGIAHEINNPLSTILSNTQHMLAGELNEDNKDSLEWIEQETNRIARIVRELLDFAHVPSPDVVQSDVNECVTDVVRLVRYGLSGGNGVTIELITNPTISQAAVSPDELKQLVLNLVQNAVHAIDGTGAIRVETSKYDESFLNLTVSDDGPGIPDTLLPRIFDPFFTTKPDGIGTGLGLSIVYGIVKKAGGDIDVESSVGRGTTFKMRLPIYEDRYEQ